MSIFGHQPDGFIYIDTLPPMPLSFYLQRHPDYAPPAGVVRMEYMQGQYRTVNYSDGTAEDLGPEWKEGDALIAAGEEDAQAYLDSLVVPPDVTDDLTDQQRLAIETEAARTAALRALDDQRLADALKSADVPAEVLRYVELKGQLQDAVAVAAITASIESADAK